MQLARVIGRVTATVKHPALDGRRLIVCQPLTAGGDVDGDPVVAVDTMGCRSGSDVVLNTDGKAARSIVGRDDSPVRHTVLAVPD